MVHTPVVLRRAAQHRHTDPSAREWAEEQAALLERLAAEYRQTYHGGPHPGPCRCHECLTLTPDTLTPE
ncbi:hypothetical protein GCM10020367_49470 [Streptomyces sannanensis]|uniref:Uncharacterized protein n=1 Tax=Streptomyces sannanensis TaxID=285536 RepID=A0ABP6SH16_9ACTN